MKVAIDAVGIRGHGGAAVLCELLQWMPTVRPDWEWHVFIFKRHLREFDDPLVSNRVVFEHTDCGNSGRSRLRWVNNLIPKRLEEIKADVLFAFSNIAPSRSGVPQVVFCHQAYAFFSDALSTLPLLKQLHMLFMRYQILRGARASQALIVQTDAMLKRILEIEPALVGRVHVIPSGYRTAPAVTKLSPAIKSLIDCASRPRLIYVSHPGRNKNHLALIRAMSIILKTFPSASMLLTLDKQRMSDPLYQSVVDKLLHEAEALGVNERLVWLGILNPDEVDYALRSSDLMVFPSLAESFGLGLVEAMAAGCPVAAADLPYAHDVCGGAAVYFLPRNPENIAEVVVRTCSDPTSREKLRGAAAQQQERYSYRKIAEEFACVLEMATKGAK